MLTCFEHTYIQPKPDKFQFSLVYNAVESSIKSMKVGDTILERLE